MKNRISSIFPTKLLIINILFTILTLSWSIYHSYKVNDFYNKYIINENKISDIISDIIYLDEVLTMSAINYATTSDEKWKIRYLERERELNLLLKNLLDICKNQDILNTIEANDNLVEIEKKSIKLTTANNGDEAYKILSNPYYIINKNLYTASTIHLKESRRQKTIKTAERQELNYLINLAIVILLILSTITLWIFLFRTISTSQDNIVKINDKLKSSINQLHNSNQALQRFAYACSHEFKEPIRNISNLLSLFFKINPHLKKNPKNTELKMHLDKSLTSMYNIVDGLLSYSKIEHSSEKIRREKVILSDLLEEIKLESKSLGSKAKIIITNDLPEIIASYQIIKILFKNIITNAIKYQCPNQIVKIQISYQDLGSHHLFLIKDSGIGIAEKYKNDIFKLFFHINSTENSTGIGLSLCQKIVELYQGSIKVISKGKNKGSEFIFTIQKQE
ncbi:MAG: signal transduction histidine kinase [Rickettsiales bacterium]|jgi:signal transduction histidine kinase